MDSIKIKEIGDIETYNLCQNGSFAFAFIQNISITIGEILTDFAVGKANGTVTHFDWDIKQVTENVRDYYSNLRNCF